MLMKSVSAYSMVREGLDWRWVAGAALWAMEDWVWRVVMHCRAVQ